MQGKRFQHIRFFGFVAECIIRCAGTFFFRKRFSGTQHSVRKADANTNPDAGFAGKQDRRLCIPVTDFNNLAYNAVELIGIPSASADKKTVYIGQDNQVFTVGFIHAAAIE
ncbi:hypothetical protein SDC9_208218 [bioreactor metagenome]|uniref:Uncharacterized protein n=1 Tax=bioreactor metagenome TaxID=1076179 RepID=A0A645JBN7_9ZZZZ